MRVCVVGSGGREHALAHVLSRTAEVLVTPGSPGIPGSVATPPAEVAADLYVVTDMAGGYYPLEERAGVPYMRATIARTPGSAAEQLSGAPLTSMRGMLAAPPAGALHAP